MKKLKEILIRFQEITKEENRDALALILKELVYLLKHGRFRKLKGNLDIGLEDPYLMGRILSVLSLAYPVYGENLKITPYFDKKELKGRVFIKGHIRLIHVLIVAVKLLLNKRIREFIFNRDEKI